MSNGRWIMMVRALLCAGAMLAMAVPASRANDGLADDTRLERPAPVSEQCPCPRPPP